MIYLNYHYRYESNDKLHGSVGFHALGGITLEEAERRLKAVWPDGQFNPQSVIVPALDNCDGIQHEFVGLSNQPGLQNHADALQRTLRDFVEQAEKSAAIAVRRYQFELSMENGPDETLNSLPSKFILQLTGAEIEWVLEQMALVEKSVDEETGSLVVREIVVRPPAEQVKATFPNLPDDVFAQLVIEAGYAYIRAHHIASCAADGETISVTREELRQALTKGDNLPAPVSVDAGFADTSFPTTDEIIEYAKKYVGDKPWPEDDWVQGSRFALNIWMLDGQKRITYYTLEANDEIDTSKGVGFVVP